MRLFMFRDWQAAPTLCSPRLQRPLVFSPPQETCSCCCGQVPLSRRWTAQSAAHLMLKQQSQNSISFWSWSQHHTTSLVCPGVLTQNEPLLLVLQCRMVAWTSALPEPTWWRLVHSSVNHAPDSERRRCGSVSVCWRILHHRWHRALV